MKRFTTKFTSTLVIMLAVAACSSLNVGSVVKDVKEGPPQVKDYKEAMDLQLGTQDYSKWLQKDYKAITLFEYDEMFDYDSAEHFGLKSLAAGRGQILKPDAVSSRNIRADYVPEATSMYNSIEEAYAKGKNIHFPKDMARLQVSYDCWLEQVEEDIQPNHIMKCKDLFYEALANMKDVPPVAEIKPISAILVLYFETGSSSLRLDEAQKLETVVKNKEIAHSAIVIDGYADTVDTDEYNLKLSQKRAETVRHAIEVFDPNIQNISIKAFGENDLAIPTADDVSEPHNRRVVVYFNN